MATWTDQDFRAVFTFLDEIRSVLKECPEKTKEYRDILLEDLERCSASFNKIHDAVACS